MRTAIIDRAKHLIVIQSTRQRQNSSGNHRNYDAWARVRDGVRLAPQLAIIDAIILRLFRRECRRLVARLSGAMVELGLVAVAGKAGSAKKYPSAGKADPRQFYVRGSIPVWPTVNFWRGRMRGSV